MSCHQQQRTSEHSKALQVNIVVDAYDVRKYIFQIVKQACRQVDEPNNEHWVSFINTNNIAVVKQNLEEKGSKILFPVCSNTRLIFDEWLKRNYIQNSNISGNFIINKLDQHAVYTLTH